jgi:hypothetical protein
MMQALFPKLFLPFKFRWHQRFPYFRFNYSYFGKVKIKLLPLPGWLSTRIVPP